MAMLSLKNHTELLSPSSIPIPFPHTAFSSFSLFTPSNYISLNPRITTSTSKLLLRRFAPGVGGGGNNSVNRMMVGCGLQMKMHFFLQDLLEVVKKGVPNLKKGASDAHKAAERKDSTALHLIRESVNFEAFWKIATAETAKDAWEILEEAYYDNDSRDTSMVPEETIEEIGQNFGITNMSPDVSSSKELLSTRICFMLMTKLWI